MFLLSPTTFSKHMRFFKIFSVTVESFTFIWTIATEYFFPVFIVLTSSCLTCSLSYGLRVTAKTEFLNKWFSNKRYTKTWSYFVPSLTIIFNTHVARNHVLNPYKCFLLQKVFEESNFNENILILIVNKFAVIINDTDSSTITITDTDELFITTKI